MPTTLTGHEVSYVLVCRGHEYCREKFQQTIGDLPKRGESWTIEVAGRMWPVEVTRRVSILLSTAVFLRSNDSDLHIALCEQLQTSGGWQQTGD